MGQGRTKRLTDLYQPGDAVEIFLDQTEWLSGAVIGRQPPAVWVRTVDGRVWFVTNGSRIRKLIDEAGSG